MGWRSPRWRRTWVGQSTPPRRCWSGRDLHSAARTAGRRPAMPDPLDGLREPIVPIDPDPAFAGDLRRRIVQALRGPTGGVAATATTGPLPPSAIEAAHNQLSPTVSAYTPQLPRNRQVVLPPTISVKDLARRLRVRPGDVIKKLMSRGVMATLNQVIDHGAAEILAGDFGYTVEPIASEDLTMSSRYRTLTPYIAVVDTPRALDWYDEVFAARRSGDFVVDPDGKIGHAELEIGDATLMLGEDRHPGAKAPGSSIFILVPDADATVRLAVTRGAELERPVADEPYGRTGVV